MAARSAHCTPALGDGEGCRRRGARGGRAGGSKSESWIRSLTGNKSGEEQECVGGCQQKAKIKSNKSSLPPIMICTIWIYMKCESQEIMHSHKFPLSVIFIHLKLFTHLLLLWRISLVRSVSPVDKNIFQIQTVFPTLSILVRLFIWITDLPS